MQRLMLTTRHRSASASALIFFPSHAARKYSFIPGPSPPKLPPAQQAEFERLQRQAAVSMAFQPKSQSADAHLELEKVAHEQVSASEHETVRKQEAAAAVSMQEAEAEAEAEVADEHVNQGLLRRGAPPEFKGDTNPKTGEVGGPKNNPLKWGSEGDWSYNGRVTDF